jgi:hypothetical protein
VIAKGRVELHSRIQQSVVRYLELLPEIMGLVSAVDVVAQHDDELEIHLLAIEFHLLG